MKKIILCPIHLMMVFLSFIMFSCSGDAIDSEIPGDTTIPTPSTAYLNLDEVKGEVVDLKAAVADPVIESYNKRIKIYRYFRNESAVEQDYYFDAEPFTGGSRIIQGMTYQYEKQDFSVYDEKNQYTLNVPISRNYWNTSTTRKRHRLHMDPEWQSMGYAYLGYSFRERQFGTLEMSEYYKHNTGYTHLYAYPVKALEKSLLKLSGFANGGGMGYVYSDNPANQESAVKLTFQFQIRDVNLTNHKYAVTVYYVENNQLMTAEKEIFLPSGTLETYLNLTSVSQKIVGASIKGGYTVNGVAKELTCENILGIFSSTESKPIVSSTLSGSYKRVITDAEVKFNFVLN